MYSYIFLYVEKGVFMELKDLAVILDMDLISSVERFGNNEIIFKKFLKKFSEDKTYSILCEAIENKDYENIEKSAHTLKGISANLGLTNLQECSNEIVWAVRNKEFDNIYSLFDNLKNNYDIIIKNLSELD